MACGEKWGIVGNLFILDGGPTMSLRGYYEYAIDDKGRVNVPAKLRKAAGTESDESYIITLGLDRCIYVYPPAQWTAIEGKLDHLSSDLADERYYTRTITSHASDSQVDAQGRITLPRPLLDKLSIEKKVVIIGVQDHFEIWKPETYQKYMEQGPGAFEPGTYEQVAEQIFQRRKPQTP
jgi:MraZ protein